MPLPVAILAGGLATRLRPVTTTVPKALVDINGEPFIAHQLRLLRSNGIERVVLCVSYLGEMIRDAIGDGARFGIQIEYVFDGPVLRGTAGAIQNALSAIGSAFFVLYGDSYLPCNYYDVEEAFHRSGAPALMTVFRNEGQWDASNVEFAGGKIIAYDKQNPTPGMRHIDYGLGVFHASAFDTVPPQGCYDLARLYQDLLARGQLAGYEVSQRFYEIGSFQGIRETRRFLSPIADNKT